MSRTHGVYETHPIEVANAFADFVVKNNFDGVDVDWEDNAAMNFAVG